MKKPKNFKCKYYPAKIVELRGEKYKAGNYIECIDDENHRYVRYRSWHDMSEPTEEEIKAMVLECENCDCLE